MLDVAQVVKWQKMSWEAKRARGKFCVRLLTLPAGLSPLASPLTDCSAYESVLTSYVIQKNTIQTNATEWFFFYGAWLLIFPKLGVLTICEKICNLWTLKWNYNITYRENNTGNHWIIFHWWIPNSIDIRLMCLKRVHCMTSPDIPYKGCFIASLTRQNKLYSYIIT